MNFNTSNAAKFRMPSEMEVIPSNFNTAKASAMNLEHLSQKDHGLTLLLQQVKIWRKLDAQVKTVIPPNLHAHCRVACIDEDCLVIVANNGMACSRLRMLIPSMLPKIQTICSNIQSVRIKVMPATPPKPRANTLQLSGETLDGLHETASRLSHHPQLANALNKLADKYKK